MTNYKFVDTNSDAILSSLISEYEHLAGRTLNPADPERLFISWIAGILVQERVSQNFVGNQNIPSRAVGENLDALGELIYNVKRTPAQSAKCTVRFSIAEAQTTSILIPCGTRVTDSSNVLTWKTTTESLRPIGETAVDIMVQCEKTGSVGNGYAPGQINTLIDVDNILYFESCQNIDTSSGGCERASDEEYFELMKAGMDAYSVAGPSGAYEYLAKSVSSDIADVKAVQPKEEVSATLSLFTKDGEKHAFIGGDQIKVDTLKVYNFDMSATAELDVDYQATYSDGLLDIKILSDGFLANVENISVSIEKVKAGYVHIYTLMNDGSIAGEVIKKAVLAACRDDASRPMTDCVQCMDPDTIQYNIDITYYIDSERSASVAEIQDRAKKAVDEYIAWQSAKLGRDINPSKLYNLLMQAGVKRVEITSPCFSVLKNGKDNTVPQIATIDSVKITNGGFEDE